MKKFYKGQKKVLAMAVILTAVALSIQIALITIFYLKDIDHHQVHLKDILNSHLMLIQTISEHDKNISVYVKDELPEYNPTEATLSQLEKAHKKLKGIGEDGEIVIAHLENYEIVFSGINDSQNVKRIPFDSKRAQPMRLALQGRTGTVQALDYNGDEVIAAYTYVEELDIGLVAKVSVSEIREPFVKAGVIGFLVSFVFIFFGTLSLFKITNPMIESLKNSNERLKKAFDQAGDAMFMLDEENQFVDVNLMACTNTGHSRDELLQMNVFELDPFIQKEDIEDMRISMSNGEHLTFESIHQHKNGHEIPVEINSGLFKRDGNVYILAIVRDITKRIASDKALRSNEEKLRSIYSSMNEGLCLHEMVYDEDQNAIDYRIIEINPAYESILCLKRTEVLGQLASYVYKCDEAPYLSLFHQVVLSGVSKSFESHFKPLDKHFHISVFRTSDDKFATVFSDITENKRLNELKSRAERLETAGQIAGQVAHDFNNLLAPLLGYPEFIRDELPEDHPALEYLESIEQSALKIAEINQQLLTLGRRGHYTQDVINLNNVVTQVLRDMGKLPEKISCRLDLDSNLMNVRGGEAQIYRVLNNMITNSCDALGDSGEIYIKTENYYLDSDKKLYDNIPKGEYVKLLIKDSGSGISPEVIETIFDPFFTTKKTDKKRGSGLGLSVVDSVIKDHRGFIDLSSEVGVGTEFYIYVPICRDEIASVDDEKPQGGDESLLLVDDDETQRNVSCKILEKLGYTVDTANCGKTALDKVKSNKYDLVILDMIMPPGIDGAETYNQILQINPDQKAIIVSGYSESQRVQVAQELGAGQFVKKPFSYKVISKAVRNELDQQKTPVAQKSI